MKKGTIISLCFVLGVAGFVESCSEMFSSDRSSKEERLSEEEANELKEQSAKKRLDDIKQECVSLGTISDSCYTEGDLDTVISYNPSSVNGQKVRFIIETSKSDYEGIKETMNFGGTTPFISFQHNDTNLRLFEEIVSQVNESELKGLENYIYLTIEGTISASDGVEASAQDCIIVDFKTVRNSTDYKQNLITTGDSYIESVAVAEKISDEEWDKSVQDLKDSFSDLKNALGGNSNSSDDKRLSVDEYKAKCSPYNHEDIVRQPDNYNGVYVTTSGTVHNYEESSWTSGTKFFITDSSGNEWCCDYNLKDGDTHIKNGDSVTVYGKCDGTALAENIFGTQYQLPKISVMYIN